MEEISGFIKASKTLPVFNLAGLFRSGTLGVDGVSGNLIGIRSAGAGGLNLKLLNVLFVSDELTPFPTFIGSEK